MNVFIGDDITVDMSADELGAIRYALEEGVEKLESLARFHTRMGHKCADSARITAETARAVSDALETAVQKFLAESTK